MIKHMMPFCAALAMLAGAAPTAKAAPITSDVWYSFVFGGVGSEASPGGSGNSSLGTPYFSPGDAPWTITFGPGGGAFTVVDAFLKGDRFDVYDFGVLIGTTSLVPSSDVGTTDDPWVALADPTYSSGTFALAGGEHSLTIVTNASPFGNGGAYFRATGAVPEPASMALCAPAILAGAFAWRRARRKVSTTA